ncbi:hypothetical protein APHAL10511_000974 [Amanita phalloides]|nr:hypothetical protein APHAL10511_000974 [Amanita phalloides]
MGVTHVVTIAGSSTESTIRKHKNRRKLNKKRGTQTAPAPAENDDGIDLEGDFASTSRSMNNIQNGASKDVVGQSSSSGDGEDDDALMIDVNALPAGGSGAPVFAPLAPGAAKSSSATKSEMRRIPIPPHRMSPLKKDWVNIFGPLTELLGLQVRMNVQKRCVETRTSKHTKDIGAVQKGADFVKAYALGFDVNDAIALLRLDDLYLDSFEIKDVKTLHGDHLSRAIGRIAGHEGKTKFTIENVSRTRIVLADTKIHIMGSFQNIKIARDAIVSLILGSPPGKVYAGLRTVASRMKQRAL